VNVSNGRDKGFLGFSEIGQFLALDGRPAFGINVEAPEHALEASAAVFI
jgi:hypothetical protein